MANLVMCLKRDKGWMVMFATGWELFNGLLFQCVFS